MVHALGCFDLEFHRAERFIHSHSCVRVRVFGLYLPRLSAKIDPKIELYLTHRNGLIFTAKTDFSGLQ